MRFAGKRRAHSIIFIFIMPGACFFQAHTQYAGGREIPGTRYIVADFFREPMSIFTALLLFLYNFFFFEYILYGGGREVY